MNFGTLEVELPQGFAGDKPCADCGSSNAPLWVDGQPQCLEHAGSRLQADPEAMGKIVLVLLEMDLRLKRIDSRLA